MRRKSSSFRPHDWVYPSRVTSEKISTKLTLEQLPVVILESVFDYLQTPDLLQLCLVSRYFYLPAANRLYQRICITDDSLAIKYAKGQMREWRRNYCTVVTSSNIEILLGVIIKNEKIAAMIHALIITTPQEVPLIPSLLSHLRLRTLYYGGSLKIPTEAAQTLQELTCSLSSALVYAPNLYELKINYQNKNSDYELFEKLALNMIELNCYRNLKKLVFEHLEERNLHLLNNFNNERAAVSPLPPWLNFFKVFSEKRAKLNLMALGLDGFLGNMGMDAVQLLDLVVKLRELNTLELKHTEHSHPGQAHREKMTTFLEAFTRNTSLLQYLSINPTDNCLTCQIDAITHILRDNIPNQLKGLQVKIEPRTSLDSETIEGIILKHQRRLSKLKFEDRSSTIVELGRVMKNLDTQRRTQWHDDLFYGEKTKRTFMPPILNIEEPRPYVSDSKVESIKICKEDILKFLKSNRIYEGASINLPLLVEYCVLGLYINVKECGVFANGETILLE